MITRRHSRCTEAMLGSICGLVVGYSQDFPTITPRKGGVMYLRPLSWIDILAVCARAQQTRIEVQHTRRLAAETRQRALLTCVARHMPEANFLTRAVTAEILKQHGLFGATPTKLGNGVPPAVPDLLHTQKP